MERAIKDIMAPIVQRSVTIATQTTKELVLKVSIIKVIYFIVAYISLIKLSLTAAFLLKQIPF